MHPSFILSNIIHKYHVFAKPGSATSVTVQQKVTLRKKKMEWPWCLPPLTPRSIFKRRDRPRLSCLLHKIIRHCENQAQGIRRGNPGPLPSKQDQRAFPARRGCPRLAVNSTTGMKIRSLALGKKKEKGKSKRRDKAKPGRRLVNHRGRTG
ncbi:hypothetical protein POX_e06567 [Penicillium oxalicum]|uniref:hypothetical protein n=1 Tax=Penicillium oxalicum TaxID=69781 RepID=UPI0020B85FFA|nr:hypothetical protein POX_e06567 [Penicillium oxalicum]KAI2788548.1 hypothetical protein POX_e06567 [Penicillium oxalicum]